MYKQIRNSDLEFFDRINSRLINGRMGITVKEWKAIYHLIVIYNLPIVRNRIDHTYSWSACIYNHINYPGLDPEILLKLMDYDFESFDRNLFPSTIFKQYIDPLFNNKFNKDLIKFYNLRY